MAMLQSDVIILEQIRQLWLEDGSHRVAKELASVLQSEEAQERAAAYLEGFAIANSFARYDQRG